MQDFLNTAVGSWLKVFISSILTAWLLMLTNGQKLFSWDLQMIENLLTVGVVSTLPIVINYLNPKDPRYGK